MVSIQCGEGAPSDATTPPSSFNPICTNGTPSTEKVSTENIEKCISCDTGFEINGEICGRFDTICPNGIPAPIEKVSKANIEKCISCNSYYALKSDKTCAVVTVETLAGGGTMGDPCSGSNFNKCKNDIGTSAQFNEPRGVAVDAGVVYVADYLNNRIRTITLSDRMVNTLAGDGILGSMNGVGNVARFRNPSRVAVYDGTVYVMDGFGVDIRTITIPQ